MQRVFRVFAGALLFAGCAESASQAENAAHRWLLEHRQQPSVDELADLKTANPMAYGIVQALLTKQSLGLVRRNAGSGTAPSKPLTPFFAEVPADPLLEVTKPLAPSMLVPPPAAVVAEGPPTELMNQAHEAPKELPELAPRTPTVPPEMPPPPPISSALPPLLPNLEDAGMGPPGGVGGVETAAVAQEDDRSAMIKRLQAAASAPAPSAPRLSHMATSSSVSSASSGGGFGLNWHPDDMIAENERMVQNVLGAVAQLTNKHVARKPVARAEEPLALPVAEAVAVAPTVAEPVALPAAEPLAVEAPLTVPVAEPFAAPIAADSVDTTSAADESADLHEALSHMAPVSSDEQNDDSDSARAEMIKKIQASSSASDSADLHEALSHMATSSSVSSGSGGGGLNYNPNQMMADNERMVQNVLGAVAQLTNKRVHRAPMAGQKSVTSPDAQDSRSVRPQASATKMVAAPAAPAMSAADMYLSSGGRPAADESVGGLSERDDAMAGHLPGALSWSNPYAGANVQPVAQRENSYLKDIDFGLGVPQVQPRRRSPDEENPYLQGLNLKSDKSAPTDISDSALTAMHQSQLLSSHRLLSSFDWGDAKPPPLHKPQARKTVKAPKEKKDSLVGFLGPAKGARQKGPPAAMVSKNAYLAKLGDAGATAAVSSSSSSAASSIEQDNAYMMTLDDVPARQEPQASVSAPPRAEPRDRLASFRWDDDQPPAVHQLSMAARHQVHAKVASKSATKRVTVQKGRKTQSLSGWLAPPTPAKAPNPRALRLQRAVAQRVADARNPYLRGLDMEPQKVQSEQESGNPYMAGLD